jgi:hypothetical protein
MLFNLCCIQVDARALKGPYDNEAYTNVCAVLVSDLQWKQTANNVSLS